ncbi:MAG: hypothetical protein ACFFAE_10300 [Candidatus Hodarchaeota archaeon]
MIKPTLIVVSLILISPCFISSKPNLTVKIEQNQDPILFLHGHTVMPKVWNTMKYWFRINGWNKTLLYNYAFEDRWDGTIQGNINNAKKIKQWVDQILAETGAEKIDLVSHSMGGVSSRYYVKFLGGIDKVDDYVSLGAEHHSCAGNEGSDDGCWGFGTAFMMSLNEGDETPGGILNDTLGERIAPYSGIIYNGTHIPGNISYTSIYSQADMEVPWRSSILEGAINIKVLGLAHAELHQDWDVYKMVRTAVDNFNTTFLMTPPTSLNAIPGDSQVELNWKPPVDDGESPIIKYKIYRATSSGGPYSFIGNTTTLGYLDLNVTNDVMYYYVVTAVNNINESEYCSEASVTPYLPSLTTTSAPVITPTTTTTPSTTPTTSTPITRLPTTTTSSSSIIATTPSGNILLLIFSLFALTYLWQLIKRS